ncbi:unnamed protein product [Prorocentrum cordatum]|nr:unnamed protein product [Polarella glacialis]
MVDAKLHGNSQLDVVFSDGHHSQFFLPRVQSELRSFDRNPIQVNEYDRPSPVLWSGDAYELPVFQHDEVLEDGDEGERLRLIKGLLTSGAALVKGVPRREGEVCRFGQTLSTLRTTNWGSFFNVRTVPDTSAEAGEGRSLTWPTPRARSASTRTTRIAIGPQTSTPPRARALQLPRGRGPLRGLLRAELPGRRVLRRREAPEGEPGQLPPADRGARALREQRRGQRLGPAAHRPAHRAQQRRLSTRRVHHPCAAVLGEERPVRPSAGLGDPRGLLPCQAPVLAAGARQDAHLHDAARAW